MLLILPPSETKRSGGAEGTRLDLAALAYPELAAPRRAALAALRRLSRNLAAAAGALRLGPSLAAEAARNRVVTTSPVLPALDRYDGVLYDALDAPTLSPEARAFARDHVVIASALFGLTSALDPIPAYRLSPDSRMPGVSLARLWRDPIAGVLARVPGPILDLRSEAYVALGPIPPREDARYLRVVTVDGDGRRRALNHFNKTGKGALVRAILLAGIDTPDVDALVRWARDSGIRLEPGAPGELDLVV